MKKHYKNPFTLVELLAAMAVFAILLAVSLQLFSGAQNIWLRSERKTDTFAGARTAMEFLASRLQTLVFVDTDNDAQRYPFNIDDDSGSKGAELDSIWFISRMARGNGGHYRHIVKFRLVDPDGTQDNAGTLQMIVYSGQNARGSKNFYGQLFPTYRDSSRRDKVIKSISQANTHINNVFKAVEDSGDKPTVDSVETYAAATDIIENVIGLKLEHYTVNADGDGLSNALSGDSSFAPYLIDIELRVLDSRESFLLWQKASNEEKNKIFMEHGYTFRRAVLLGKKGSSL